MPQRRLSIRSAFYFAIFVALVATVGAYRVLQASKLQPEERRRRVVVAATDIPEGATIKAEALRVAELPPSAVSPNAFTAADSLVGRITRVPIFAGDVIVPQRLAPRGSGPGLEVNIAPGMRAMAVKVDDVAGSSGLIQPGSRVDVLVTLAPAQNAKRVSKLFLENLRVLSLGSVEQLHDAGKPGEASTATLEVDPAQAERLAAAMSQGTIQLVLRGDGDPAPVTTAGASSSDVLSQLRAVPERAVSAREAPGRNVPERTAPARAVERPHPHPRSQPHSEAHTEARRARHAAPVSVRPGAAPASPPPSSPANPASAPAKAQSDTVILCTCRGGGEGVEKKVEKTDSVRRKPKGGAP